MRVFWLGMHKILIHTELPRLRQLGFEVFCPAYNNRSTQHQSAANGWTADQPTTLPPEVFRELSETSFFYQELSARTLNLLNQYFDAVIVTIDPAWLIEVLKGYKGKVIYRTFGHVENMSDFLFHKNAMPGIVERDNFWHVPHALECALHDHQWLRDRMEVVPYCVMPDATTNRDQWPSGPIKNEIMISCPNIANPYYRAHYENLKKYFTDPVYRFYGVQTSVVDDPQMVGTISFAELLKAYTQSAGFLYTYREPTVCFLPPIEMMIAGGPVIFLQGSLLDQYFPSDDRLAPGRARDEKEALAKCARLLPQSPAYDPTFVNAVIESQRSVRSRYIPDDVWPIFDRTFKRLLDPATTNVGLKFLSPSRPPAPQAVVDVFTERFEITFSRGVYTANDFDLGHLKATISKAIAEHGEVTLLGRWEQIPFWQGLLGTPPGLLFQSVDRPLKRKMDKILYSADASRGRLRFALTHPGWLAFKLLTVFRTQIQAIMTRTQKLWPLRPDPRKAVLGLISGQTHISIFSASQSEFYRDRGLTAKILAKPR